MKRLLGGKNSDLMAQIQVTSRAVGMTAGSANMGAFGQGGGKDVPKKIDETNEILKRVEQAICGTKGDVMRFT